MNKSKITVIGFVVFVLSVYTGSYYYTKNNNERLLSSPRLVLLQGDEAALNSELLALSTEQRRDKMRTLYDQGVVLSVSQLQYDYGVTDIMKFYQDNDISAVYTVADCMDYSVRLERTMIKVDKNTLKDSWIFSACGISS
ncbi:MAG: hypothetical protein HOJ34_00805 [Kordiimonadaceae bacterium]|nr:hypothetical protein [Kordiimonadaceae bacterium]MBT6035733.1 hypothetical protein [Kordiimonadaceae bacterium]MBT6328295.1 hypothetical protein [Kordiimonadaceae bacterium]MBT7582076.1 hypothetical protein [Kordiimonadaceae bacterium]